MRKGRDLNRFDPQRGVRENALFLLAPSSVTRRYAHGDPQALCEKVGGVRRGPQPIRGMTAEGFLARLKNGKAVNCVYRLGELSGLISSWRYDDAFVLTWEECRDGDQEDEHLYTRDELHRFVLAEEVLAFVETAGYPPSRFGP